MSDVFQIQLPDGRTVGVRAESPEEAAQGARAMMAREKGAAEGTSQTQAAGHAFTQGATFGFADELAAAVRSVLPEFIKQEQTLQRAESIGGNEQQPQFSAAPTIGQRYGEELANIRGRQEAEKKNFPATTTAANIAGNVAGATLALPASATSIGPSLVGNIAKGAAVGGALGGAQGFGEGEGSFANRATNAAVPAAFGAAGGAAVPIIAKGVDVAADTRLGRAVQQNVIAPALTWAGEKLGGQVPVRSLSAAAPDTGPMPEGFGQSLVNAGQSMAQPARSAALQDFATTLQKSDLTPEQIAAELDRLGPEGLFVDVNRQLMRKGRGLATLTGQTGDLSQSVLRERVAGRPDRMIAAFEGGEPPPPTSQMLEAFDQNARAVGSQAYGEMAGNKLHVSAEMSQIMREAPAIGEALQQVADDAARTGTKLAPIEALDRVKQQLNRNADAAFASGRAVNKADIGALADRFEGAFWRANPSAQKAAESYAQAKSLPEFFDRGRNFLAGGTNEKAIDASSSALAQVLMGADPQQAIAARAGSTTAARDLMTGMGAQPQANRIIRGINQGPDVRARLGELYGSEHAGNIVNRSDIERRFMDTEKQFLNQSNSIDKAVEAADVGNATIRLSPSGVGGYLKERVGDFLAHHFGPSQALRDEYGRLLFSTDPATRKEALKIAEELLRQRAAGTAPSTALGAAVAQQVTR